MLDTLKCEGAFRADGCVDMLDTLTDVVIPSFSVGCATELNPEIEPTQIKTRSKTLKGYNQVLTIAFLDQFDSRSMNCRRGGHRQLLLRIASGALIAAQCYSVAAQMLPASVPYKVREGAVEAVRRASKLCGDYRHGRC